MILRHGVIEFFKWLIWWVQKHILSNVTTPSISMVLLFINCCLPILKLRRLWFVFGCNNHRTVSDDATLVQAKTTPIDLLILARIRIRARKSAKEPSIVFNQEERKAILKEWQPRWERGDHEQSYLNKKTRYFPISADGTTWTSYHRTT